MEANAISSKVCFKSADCKGSKGAIWSAWSTRARSQEGQPKDLILICSTLERKAQKRPVSRKKSRHESTHPSGRSLQTNLGDGCTRKCVSAWAFWTVACEGSDLKLAGPRSVETHSFYWVQWIKGCKTLTSYRLEGPALLRPSPAGLRSPQARCGRRQLKLKWSGMLWTWGDAGRTESHRCLTPDGPNEPVRRTGERGGKQGCGSGGSLCEAARNRVWVCCATLTWFHGRTGGAGEALVTFSNCMMLSTGDRRGGWEWRGFAPPSTLRVLFKPGDDRNCSYI